MKYDNRLMKFGLAIILASSFTGAVAAGLPSHFRQVGMKRAPRREAPAALMLPASEQIYFKEDGWVLVGEMRYEYDCNGNVTRMVVDELGSITSVICQYDSYNQIISRLEMDGEEKDGEYISKRTYEYDPIVHTYCIKRMGYDWDGTDWTPNYFCETNEVTRNLDGNVTRVLKSLPYNLGDMVPAYLSEWGYDDSKNGNADSYSYYLNMGGKDISWTLNNDIEYREIKWERTDGQLLGDLIEMVVDNPDSPNRFSSARAYFEGEPDGYVFATYPAGNEPGFRITYTANDPEEVGMVQELNILDADTYAYSYKITQYFDDETEEFTKEPTYIIEQVFMADHKGNPVCDLIYETYPESERELVAGINYNNSYDETGNLIEVTQSEYDYESGEYFETMRTVYADYVDVTTGIDNTYVKNTLSVNDLTVMGEGDISVYSADGMIVASGKDLLDLSPLAKGIYIVRCGRESVKVIR